MSDFSISSKYPDNTASSFAYDNYSNFIVPCSTLCGYLLVIRDIHLNILLSKSLHSHKKEGFSYIADFCPNSLFQFMSSKFF